jgi:hypothetical protein
MWVNPYYFVGHTTIQDPKPWWQGQKWEHVALDRHQKEYRSGWIELSVTTKGYLSFGDPERTWWLKCPDDEKRHRVSDFFTVNDRLAIPGSELRGMVRTNMEAVLDARAGVLNLQPDKPFSYRLTAGKRVYGRQVGILNLSTQQITPCRFVKIPRTAFLNKLQAMSRFAGCNAQQIWRSVHGCTIEVIAACIHRRGTAKSGEVVCKFRWPGDRTDHCVLTASHKLSLTHSNINERSMGKLEVVGTSPTGKKVKGFGPELNATGFTVGNGVTATIADFDDMRDDKKHCTNRVIGLQRNATHWDAYLNAEVNHYTTAYIYVPRDIRDPVGPQNSQYILAFVPLHTEAPTVDAGVINKAKQADDRFCNDKFLGPQGAADCVFVRYFVESKEVREIGAVGMFRWPECESYKSVLESDTFLLPPVRNANLDPVSRLFGWVPPEGNNDDHQPGGFQGRLSFEPLIGPVADDNSLEQWKTLPIRGEPKPQFYPFYLRSNNGGLARYSGVQAMIRGRKFYWHFPVQKRSNLGALCNAPATHQNATERLCKPGQVFRGRIYFENLEPWELGALLWTMTFSANPFEPSADHGHHLGGGAATGFGSVQLKVDKIYTVDHEKEWDALDANGITQADASTASQWTEKFLHDIGSKVGLNEAGAPAQSHSPVSDWWEGHKLEALSKWQPQQIGYRQDSPPGGDLQAPRYYGKIRGKRESANQGQEEALKSVTEVVGGSGQLDL